MTVEFPEIRTGRLTLRRLTEDDRETVVEIQTDPRTNRHNPTPPDRVESLAKFDSWLADWAELGFCYVAVVETATGSFAGVGGLQLRQFDGEEILNLYYRFRPEFWGRGYATEMASAVIAWADRTVPRYPVQISVSLSNTPSLRVAGRLGFQPYRDSVHDGVPSRHFRRGPA
ncbi:GNAT family N-acetyltransferase [Amycolatopsis cynarae]|uniref:GNAT family N-acetyltransferase n=1 Tax=Amycolatopsis cynarae TaxID=2995223 RepID=A0ABY7AWR2_9PSEU|nr:GNAT family N-acetyltransferase [Amycolatopsis sp. HUAS 11-8]WAL64436.1 GNAT family N-acetyltransferase [Amycolatopsis sp. HUAS 11-8]